MNPCVAIPFSRRIAPAQNRAFTRARARAREGMKSLDIGIKYPAKSGQCTYAREDVKFIADIT